MTDKLAPINAATHGQHLELRRDNYDCEWGWLLLNSGGNICIHEQKNGETSKQFISIPRAVFNRMVRWYIKPQRKA